MKKLIEKYPKLAALLGTAAVGAAGYYGGPVAAEGAGALLKAIFGG